MRQTARRVLTGSLLPLRRYYGQRPKAPFTHSQPASTGHSEPERAREESDAVREDRDTARPTQPHLRHSSGRPYGSPKMDNFNFFNPSQFPMPFPGFDPSQMPAPGSIPGFSGMPFPPQQPLYTFDLTGSKGQQAAPQAPALPKQSVSL